MGSLSSLGLGLSLVFGFLLLALLAELYYLLWWKKRFINNNRDTVEDDHSSSARELFYLLCWKEQSSSLTSRVMSPQQLCNSVRLTNAHLGHDSVESELMRVHNLSGPPRFLFTIKEETKEDLESEEGKSRKGSRNRSLSDLLVKVETPFFTPLSSPPFFTPPLTPLDRNCGLNGFNPLFDSSNDHQVKCVQPSPPPKFKFLRDAEEKLLRRKLMEELDGNVAEKQSDQSVVNGCFMTKAQSSSMV